MNASQQSHRTTHRVVTIDGPAGSGKSTAARKLSEELGFEFLDTGAMYRAVAWRCLRDRLPLDHTQEVTETTSAMILAFHQGRLLVDGEDVTDHIRTSEISRAASVVAQHPEVRETLVELQRRCASKHDTVTEGRDQGTVVFPQADCKFFLTARVEIRAQRRFDEMAARGEHPQLNDLVTEIRERDQRDQNREVAPLIPALDAELIDTSDATLEEIVTLLKSKAGEKFRSSTGC